MLTRLERLATGRRVLAALAVALGLFALANVASVLFADAAGAGILDLSGGRDILDVRPGLTADGAHELVGRYGADGRRDHLLSTLTLDLVLPAAVFLFGALGLLHALGRLGVSERWRRLAVALPAAYLVADYSENAGIVTMLLAFPDRLATVGAVTVILTAVKSAVLPVTLLTVAASYVVVAVRVRRGEVVATR